MLSKFELLANLSAEQLREVEKICELRSYGEGEYIIREGEDTDDIYFLLSGKVELLKIEQNTQKDIKFKEMLPGQSFGEMSFVDGSPRSCSVKAVTASQIYVLPKHKLLDRVADGREILSIFGATINHQVNEYLRYLSDRHIVTLQKRIDELRDRNNFGYFFMILIIVLFFVTMTNVAVNDFFSDYNVDSIFFNWTFLIVGLFIPWLLVIGKMNLSVKEIGWTTKNIKKSTMDGVMFSSWGIITMFAIVYIIDPLFAENNLTENIWEISFPITSVFYLIHSYIQEFLRAIVQISIQKFALDEKGFYSVGITAVIFGMCHTHYRIAAILITLVMNVIFGLIYRRTYNLVGVSLFHWTIGLIWLNIGL